MPVSSSGGGDNRPHDHNSSIGKIKKPSNASRSHNTDQDWTVKTSKKASQTKKAIQFDLPKVSTTKTDMNCSFTKKMRRVEYLELDEAKLLQDQVNSYKQTPWKYDKEVSWFTSEDAKIELFSLNMQMG
ncbi:uncharacterized protein LOC112694430 [Sipha flava]|uniref:Uncharacterized protein LOC112694430 n=1 Tax=Sipha flava TaxID=143950 RepID=A0A8B8GTR0_9HEMI|nr:uncharacterized protein LOC112694430 [Sipha flava]